MAGTAPEWRNSRFTQARQIAELMDRQSARDLAPSLSPAKHFDALMAAGQHHVAATFIGIAMPRFEGVAWAAQAVAKMARTAAAEDAPVRAAIDAWLADPDDNGRRAAWDAAQAGNSDSPEWLLASAVFLSGGSMAPAEFPPVLPAPELSGKMAATAVLVAAKQSADPVAAMVDALVLARAIAEGTTQ